MNELPVEIIALVEEQTSLNPIVILHHKESDRILPIWIGDAEARAIAIAMNNILTPRPLTHHLFLSGLKTLGATLTKIIVDRIEDHTYFASIYITQNGKVFTVDARPSDALAVALTATVPIFVEETVMNNAGQKNPFPGIYDLKQDRGPRKLELSKADIARIAEHLQKAREREQKAGE